jgi:iron complex outermembrane receptor protein
LIIIFSSTPIIFASEKGDSGSYTLPDIQINTASHPGPIQQDKSDPATVATFSKETIQTFGPAGGINPYKVLNLLPSVTTESDDPFGLVQDQQSLRIRGQRGDTGRRLSQTINGLPINFPMGHGMMGNIVDNSNLGSITLYKGPVPADRGFGFGNSAGALDLTIEAPTEQFGATVEQKVGSYGFTRSFARIDSGAMPASGTRVFGSVSYAQENKWRGKGNISNFNLMGGLVQPLFDGRAKIEAYGIYNSYDQDAFRSLTYAQTKSMSNYRDFDYNSSFTGNPKVDWNYYNYNRQYFGQGSFFGNIEARLWQGAIFQFKPYYSQNQGRSYSTPTSDTTPTGSNLAYTVMDFDQRQIGYVAQLEQKFDHLQIKAGYWYDDTHAYPPPQYSQRTYLLTTYGSTFGGWSYLNKFGDYTSKAPFAQMKFDWEKVHLQAGLKYLQINVPWVHSYNTTKVPNVSYDDALNYSYRVANTSASQSIKDVWLPNAGISYDITEHLTARFMYGKNYAYPKIGPLYNTYAKKVATYLKYGISLQDVWDDAKLETSDNFEVGLRYNNGTFSISPTFFYAKYQNKSVSTYDPLTKLTYVQNVGDAESIGGELETAWKPYKWLTLFGSGSYNSFTFTKNLPSDANTVLRVKGNQIPDVPRWLFKVGATGTYKGFSVTPLFRYVDERYADVQDTRSVAGYGVFDAYLSYTKTDLWKFKEVTFSLSFQNIFDTRYIATISTSDDDSLSTASTSFNPGAPFTVLAGIKCSF